MKKKTVSALLCGIVFITVLGGCNSDSGRQPYKAEPTEAENVEKPVEEPTEAPAGPTEAPAEVTPEPEQKAENADRRESFDRILYLYKEAQAGGYDVARMDNIGLNTGLGQLGWPADSLDDEVRYVFYDVDSDGEEELVISSYGYITDIWGYDGEKARIAYINPYRGTASLYPDGWLCQISSSSATDSATCWYKFDTGLGDYFPVFEELCGENTTEYYTFCYHDIDDQGRKEVEDGYRKYGDYPVWIHEWSDQIDKTEYDKLLPKSTEIPLPEGDRISDITLPADYEFRYSAAEGSGISGDPVAITKDMQKKLNIFISNFAEQGMGNYDYGKEDMLQYGYFAYKWSCLNHYSDVKAEDGYYYVSFETVQKVVEKYFGRKLNKAELEACTDTDIHHGFIKNGGYYMPAADGEAHTGFAVVTSMEDTGSDIYRMEFTIFDLDLDAYYDNGEMIPARYYELGAANTDRSDIIKRADGYAIAAKEGDSYKLRLYQLY